MEDGLLAPIELRVQALSGAMLDYVIKACRDGADGTSHFRGASRK